MSDTVRVSVIVCETTSDDDAHAHQRFEVTYYVGQNYTVAIDTPDGRDLERAFIAGDQVKT